MTIKNDLRRRLIQLLPVPARRWAIYRKDLRLWRHGNLPSPPPLFKQRVVRNYANRFALRYLVETGTYLGDMVEAQRDRFERIVSIELDPALHEKARNRFDGNPNIELILGDSAIVLPEVIDSLKGPTLFWLDAHYSGGITARGTDETPIEAELRTIIKLGSTDDVVLIDDARDFTGSKGYPAIDGLRAMLSDSRSEWSLEVADDIIRLHK